MEVITILAIGFVCAACFLIGAKVGQVVSKGEEIKTPTLDPLKAYREREDRKEAKTEQDKLAVIMRNIEAYDGTAYGQEDVPGR